MLFVANRGPDVRPVAFAAVIPYRQNLKFTGPALRKPRWITGGLRVGLGVGGTEDYADADQGQNDR